MEIIQEQIEVVSNVIPGTTFYVGFIQFAYGSAS
jgi:hypothetical protein